MKHVRTVSGIIASKQISLHRQLAHKETVNKALILRSSDARRSTLQVQKFRFKVSLAGYRLGFASVLNFNIDLDDFCLC